MIISVSCIPIILNWKTFFTTYFLLWIHVVLNEKIEERKINLEKEQLTLQPFLACVMEENAKYYIVIDSIKYEIDTLLKALETLYKAFHVPNAQCPPECGHIWMFIQRILYDTVTPHDNVILATYSLIADTKGYCEYL